MNVTATVTRGPRASAATFVSAGLDPLRPTIFHQDWWLNAATGSNYEEVTVQAGNKTVGRFPYVVERKFGGERLCTMPELTHFLGPAIDPGKGNTVTRNLKTFHWTRQLLEQMGRFGGFYHKLHGGTSDTLAFQDAGYETSVQFTYLIPPQAEQAIWGGMRDKTRNVIRRADERWQVTSLDDPEVFDAFYAANLRQRGLINYYTKIPAVCAAAIMRGQGHISCVRDGKNCLQGAIFVVWDSHTAYYLVATRAAVSDNGVMSLLLWHAIRQASAQGLIFDFDGVGTPGSRLFFAAFGGDVAPRYIVSRHSTRYRISGGLDRLCHGLGPLSGLLLPRR
jgi:hypothetical protein